MIATGGCITVEQEVFDASIQGPGSGVSALLLFWMVVKLPAPNTNEEASTSAADICLRHRVPKAGSAVDERAHGTEPPINAHSRTDTAVPPRVEQVAVLRGEREGRVVQIAGMSF